MSTQRTLRTCSQCNKPSTNYCMRHLYFCLYIVCRKCIKKNIRKLEKELQ